jgi:hypothetical protein
LTLLALARGTRAQSAWASCALPSTAEGAATRAPRPLPLRAPPRQPITGGEVRRGDLGQPRWSWCKRLPQMSRLRKVAQKRKRPRWASRGRRRRERRPPGSRGRPLLRKIGSAPGSARGDVTGPRPPRGPPWSRCSASTPSTGSAFTSGSRTRERGPHAPCASSRSFLALPCRSRRFNVAGVWLLEQYW